MTNFESFVLGLIEMAQGLVAVLTLGLIHPTWDYDYAFSRIMGEIGPDDEVTIISMFGDEE